MRKGHHFEEHKFDLPLEIPPYSIPNVLISTVRSKNSIINVTNLANIVAPEFLIEFLVLVSAIPNNYSSHFSAGLRYSGKNEPAGSLFL